MKSDWTVDEKDQTKPSEKYAEIIADVTDILVSSADWRNLRALAEKVVGRIVTKHNLVPASDDAAEIKENAPDYIVIHSCESDELAGYVADYLRKGYKLQGGIAVIREKIEGYTEYLYSQAMIKDAGAK